MYIPTEMRHSRLEVTLRFIAESAPQPGRINREIMHKFLKTAELGEAKEYLKKKLAEGVQFDFDAPKLILNGTFQHDRQTIAAKK